MGFTQGRRRRPKRTFSYRPSYRARFNPNPATNRRLRIDIAGFVGYAEIDGPVPLPRKCSPAGSFPTVVPLFQEGERAGKRKKRKKKEKKKKKKKKRKKKRKKKKKILT